MLRLTRLRLHALRQRVKHHPRRTLAFLQTHCPPEALALDELLFFGDDPALTRGQEARLLRRLRRLLDVAPYDAA